MWKLAISVALASLGLIAIEPSREFAPLEATYAITSRFMIDPPPDDRPDRVLLWITGKGAKDMFDAMPGSAAQVDCFGAPNPTASRKVAGGLECEVLRSREYLCTVAIMLDSGRTKPGYVCD